MSTPASTAARLHAVVAPSASAATCMPSSSTSPGTPRPLIRPPRDLAPRCAAASASRSRPSPSPVSPRSPRIRGRSSSGPSRRTATTGGTPACSPSSARSRAASTRRWSCHCARWRRARSRALRARPHPRALRDRRPSRRLRLAHGLDPRRRPDRRQPRPLLLACRACTSCRWATSTPSGPGMPPSSRHRPLTGVAPWSTPVRCCGAGRSPRRDRRPGHPRRHRLVRAGTPRHATDAVHGPALGRDAVRAGRDRLVSSASPTGRTARRPRSTATSCPRWRWP